MYRISYRFPVPGWSAKPLVSAHDRNCGHPHASSERALRPRQGGALSRCPPRSSSGSGMSALSVAPSEPSSVPSGWSSSALVCVVSQRIGHSEFEVVHHRKREHCNGVSAQAPCPTELGVQFAVPLDHAVDVLDLG